MPVLLLKVHSDQGFRLTFELEGRLVEQLSSSVTQETGAQQQQQPQQSDTSPLDGGDSSSGERENPPMGNVLKDTSSKEHEPAAGTEDLANTFLGPSQAPDLFFTETSSEQELEDLCREPNFQSMVRDFFSVSFFFFFFLHLVPFVRLLTNDISADRTCRTPFSIS